MATTWNFCQETAMIKLENSLAYSMSFNAIRNYNG
jgi:hypothetical protein